MNKKVCVYADESGHSGKNLFDVRSPYFYQGAMVTLGDFEDVVAPIISLYAEKYNVDRLHANEIANKYGTHKVLEICEDLYESLKENNWKFHVTVIEKAYLPAVKLFDTFFDYYENRSVDPAWMRVESNRHTIIFYLHLLMESRVGKDFWEALCTQNQEEAKWVCTQLIVMSKKIENTDVRHAIQKTLDSASEDIGRFTFFKEKAKSSYKAHTPNMIGFDSLSHFVHEYCEKNKTSVYSFIHDLSDEFKGCMRKNHKVFKKLRSEISDDSFLNCVETDFDLGEFYLNYSNSNVMLQVTDLFLWLIQKAYPHRSNELELENSKIELLLRNHLDLFLLSSSESMGSDSIDLTAHLRYS